MENNLLLILFIKLNFFNPQEEVETATRLCNTMYNTLKGRPVQVAFCLVSLKLDTCIITKLQLDESFGRAEYIKGKSHLNL